MASEARPPPSDLVNSIFKHARARALQQTSPQAPANMPVRLIYHWRSSSQTGTESIPWKIHGTVFPTLIQEKARKDEPSTRRSMDIHGHQRKCGYSGSHGTHGAARQKLLPRRHPDHDYGCMQGLAQPAENSKVVHALRRVRIATPSAFQSSCPPAAKYLRRKPTHNNQLLKIPKSPMHCAECG